MYSPFTATTFHETTKSCRPKYKIWFLEAERVRCAIANPTYKKLEIRNRKISCIFFDRLFSCLKYFYLWFASQCRIQSQCRESVKICRWNRISHGWLNVNFDLTKLFFSNSNPTPGCYETDWFFGIDILELELIRFRSQKTEFIS